eukprot:CAMPEP_0198149132 /NCGR_PEP_ID=MMETSP1443-20131203/45147_1 /TAXON_ID=186043 /ORGANISM="Entomoneis sp., Strain CCMP2396" /LENGTH=177 /DNA_ID=CAMNT_0043814061 /DNA_START=225 /DNA_END=758 /DNA_ORIENTATION=-
MSPRHTYPVHEDRETVDREPPSLPSISHFRQTPTSVHSQSAFSVPFQGNRQRTSSAASMPPISHTADEFGLDCSINNDSSASLSIFSSRFGAVREDAPLTPGLAEVFRVSSFDKSPGFIVNNKNDLYLQPRTVTLDNRIRASTWSEPFGSGLIGSCGDISDDLASILKLSGAEDRNN